MRDELYRYMKVGIIHFMLYPETIKGEGPILRTLRNLATDPYFQVVELTWIKDPGVRAKAKAMLEQAHLEVKYGAQPRLLTQNLDLNTFDEEERKRAVNTIKEGINEAKEIGATSLGLLSGKWAGKEKRDAAIALLIDSLREICEYARGFPVTLEQFDWDIDKRALVGPIDETLEVCRELRKEYDNFGLLVDLSHLPLLRLTPHEALEPVKEYLVHVHIGNCLMRDRNQAEYGDKHPRFGVEGGENDVPELARFLKELFKIGYLSDDGPRVVSFEVSPLAGEDPEIVLASSKRVLNQAWALVK